MNPKQVATILIDIQKDFWEPMSKDLDLASFPQNVEKLLSFSREHDFHIVHVKSVFQPDRSDWMLFYRPEGRGQIPCIDGTEGIEFADFAKPLEGEKIIEKKTFDAFVNTSLDDYLIALGVKVVLIAGLETSICVLFTANSAYLRRYLPLVVSDACGDTSERHKNVLRMYSDLSFKEVTTDQLDKDYESIKKMIETFV
jgi:nicotinamidase-related amidase